ncbi:MAG: sensor histidine kinase [Candidatus Binatia bacterium]
MAVERGIIPPGDGSEATALLALRLRFLLLISPLPVLLFALADVYLARPDEVAALYAMKMAALGIAAVGFVALGRVRRRAAISAIGLTAIGALYAVSTVSALIDGDRQTTPLINIAAALVTATLLPWGLGPQLVVVLFALVSWAATIVGTDDYANVISYPDVGLVIGLGVSLYVAAEFERSRAALALHEQDRDAAEGAVRRLNEELEARVVERTAQLEQLNQALQQQMVVRGAAEAGLRASEAALVALIENADDAIWSIDRDYEISAFNSVVTRRFQALFGPHVRLGASNNDPRVHEHWVKDWKGHYDRGLAGERFSVEHTVTMPDGESHYLTSFNPIVADGQVQGLAIFSADVTARKQAEEAARQRQAELTHVLRLSTMGEMASGLAHEINQPLAAIVNYAQGSSRRLRNDASEVAAVLPVVDAIAAEALRAGEIIRRLRNMVRKEAPRQDWFDLNALVVETLHLLEPEARQRGVLLRTELAPDLPAVMGDSIQIEQVLLNLVRNAIEALADVSGRSEVLVVARLVSGEALELSVRDTGPGLPADAPDRVFDAFFSTKSGGLGMGLSISRTIVEAHHGRLWATPNAEGGTTFRLTLPIAEPALAAAGGSR